MKKIKALLVVVCAGVLLTACGNPSQKGVEYLEDGKYDQAIEQFEQAVDKKKNVGDAYRGIGIAKWEKKDYKGARKAFKKALENDAEKTGTIYNMIGNCDLKLGKAKEALNYYNLGLAQEDSGKKMKKEMQYAWLSNETGYTVFRFDDKVIRFRAPYSLERYTAVKEWDHGYLVVMAKYKHNDKPEEEYIDLAPILQNLYFDADAVLSQIKGVQIADGRH